MFLNCHWLWLVELCDWIKCEPRKGLSPPTRASQRYYLFFLYTRRYRHESLRYAAGMIRKRLPDDRTSDPWRFSCSMRGPQWICVEHIYTYNIYFLDWLTNSSTTWANNLEFWQLIPFAYYVFTTRGFLEMQPPKR